MRLKTYLGDYLLTIERILIKGRPGLEGRQIYDSYEFFQSVH